MRRFFLLLALPALSFVHAGELLIENANIVDPAKREIRRAHLHVVDGRIAAELKIAPQNFAGERIDARGKWLIPGLNDLHTHSYGNMAPDGIAESPGTATVSKRVLYAGVTGLVDLFGNENDLYKARAAQRGGAPGADIYASLSCLTAPGGHCTEYGVKTRTMVTPDDARRVVKSLAKREPDVIKLVYAARGKMPSIKRPTLQAAVAQANELGIKTVVHVSQWSDVIDAANAGASAFTHVPTHGVLPPQTAKLLADTGIASIPTLAVQTDYIYFVTEPELLKSPLARKLGSAELFAAYRSPTRFERERERRGRYADTEKQILASVKRMADAGVTILAGTDAGNWGTIQGWSVHRELYKLTQAGLSPWQALAAATTEAGEFLGVPYGVAKGDVANLVLLDASPIDDIRNTERIALVIHRGAVVDREAMLR